MTLDELWKRCILKRDNKFCQKHLSQGEWIRAIDAHHIIHKDTGFLRYHLDNGVALCRSCHDLDAQGRLKRWCVEHIGEDRYYELKRMAHESLGKPFDEDAKRKELKEFMGSGPCSS
jgi:hypothetical protein